MLAEIPTSLPELESVRMVEFVLLEAIQTWHFFESAVWFGLYLESEISKIEFVYITKFFPTYHQRIIEI